MHAGVKSNLYLDNGVWLYSRTHHIFIIIILIIICSSPERNG